MPFKKQTVTMSRKTSSLMVTQVMESHSSLTSLKTVTHERNASGQIVETWLSPTLALTSPQTWVAGPQAKFLSPPKSPSPKRRITRRSSVYVKPMWSEKSKSKASPKGLEFKIPSSSITSLSSTRSRQSAVFQKISGEPATSRRSSVYRKTSKMQVGDAVLMEHEELEVSAPKGKKYKMVSPVSKRSKLPVPPEKKSPSRVTRTRKRNVTEVEKEESSDKPAAKRRKQAGEDSFREFSKKEKRPLQKNDKKQLETSATSDTSSPAKTSRKEPKRAVRKTTRKAAQSPSPERSHSATKSVQPVSQRKITKSPSPQRSRSAKSKEVASPQKAAKSPSGQKKAAKSPAGQKKAAKSPSGQKKAAKSPAGQKKAAKSPVGQKTSAKSPSPQRTRSAKSVKKAEDQEFKSTNDNEATMESLAVINKAQKRKKTAEDDTPVQNPKQKSAKLVTPKRKSASSKVSLSQSKKSKSKKTVSGKSSGDEDRVTMPKSSRKASLFDSVDAYTKTPDDKEKSKDSKQEKTPAKKKGKEKTSKHMSHTPKLPASSKRLSEKLSTSGVKKTPQKKEHKSGQALEANASLVISSGLENQTPIRKVSGTPLTQTTSAKKRSASSSKSVRGKKATASKSPMGNTKGKTSTPKSAMKSKGKSQRSSAKKSLSAVRATSVGHKAGTDRSDTADSLDGSYLQVSGQQSTKSSLDSKKKTRKTESFARTAEDRRILEILEKAVSSTPKSGRVSTPKSAKSTKKTVIPKHQQNGHNVSTPKSQKKMSATVSTESRLSQKTSESLISVGTGPRKTLGLALSEAAQERRSSRQSLLSPLTHQSGKASVTRMRSDNILSRDVEDVPDSYLQLQKLNRRSGPLLTHTSQQGQAYQEEKSFAQYVEYRASSGIERYGTHAVECTMGDQTYRAGIYRVERKKASQAEIEREEQHWEEGDTNNSGEWGYGEKHDSTEAISDDPNATISTSTYSSRCIIL
ncbi:uncharacterized protein LOC143276213 [Babylonia areolata]|uniref:uncharacterized protein LOC143276213 n=1 Tax=Babylonia areolata TaxID=304850 RepID=UPI003FD0788C